MKTTVSSFPLRAWSIHLEYFKPFFVCIPEALKFNVKKGKVSESKAFDGEQVWYATQVR